jgi:hypothetical protein
VVELGLYEVANSASLTLVYFPALVVMGVLGLRFGYYAYWNRERSDLASQTPLWTHLVYIGLLAAAYSGLGVLEIITSLRTPYRSALMLAIVLLLAFAIREINAMAAGRERSSAEELLRGMFLALIVGHVLFGLAADRPRLLAGFEGIIALGILTYGLTFFDRQTTNTRIQGTVLDSLLRHLLPILSFSALVSVTPLAYALGIPQNVIPHIQVVFLIMVASGLMTATIKLRQNLATL